MRKERRGLKIGCGIVLLLVALLLIMSALFVTKFLGGNLSNLTAGETGSFLPSADTTSETAVSESDINDKVYNFLLVGVDTRNMSSYEGRSDSMIVITVNKQAGKVVMCSLLRDSYVDIPGYGKHKLNAAYAYGGTSLMNQTILNNYGIRIDNTAIVNFKLVADFVNACGGVDVDLTPDEVEIINNGVDSNASSYGTGGAGEYLTNNGSVHYHLNGNQALSYSRIRYIGTDFARTQRQRIVLEACIANLRKMSLSEQTAIMQEFLPRVHTDLSMGNVLSIASFYLRKNPKMDSMSLPIENSYSNQTINGEAVLVVDFDKNKEAWEQAVS